MALLFHDDCFLNHQTGQHPECPARLESILKRLKQQKVLDKFERGLFKPATSDVVSLVHSKEHINSIQTVGQRKEEVTSMPIPLYLKSLTPLHCKLWVV